MSIQRSRVRCHRTTKQISQISLSLCHRALELRACRTASVGAECRVESGWGPSAFRRAVYSKGTLHHRRRLVLRSRPPHHAYPRSRTLLIPCGGQARHSSSSPCRPLCAPPCRGAPVVRRGDARVAPPCPTTSCVWRSLPYLSPYLTLPSALRAQAAAYVPLPAASHQHCARASHGFLFSSYCRKNLKPLCPMPAMPLP